MNPRLVNGVWRYSRVLPEMIVAEAIAEFSAMGWSHHIEVYDKDAPEWFYVEFVRVAHCSCVGAESSPPPMPTIDRSKYHTR